MHHGPKIILGSQKFPATYTCKNEASGIYIVVHPYMEKYKDVHEKFSIYTIP